MLVLTLDPGVTTGILEVGISKEKLLLSASQEKLNNKEFFEFLQSVGPDVIIYERFEQRYQRKAELYSRELIGIIKLYAQTHSEPIKLYPQMPGMKDQHFKKKERIKELGLWIPSKPHAMDAMRHFLMWWSFGPGYQYNKEQNLRLLNIYKDTITS